MGRNGKIKAGKDFNGHGDTLTRVETKFDMLANGLQEIRQISAMMIGQMANIASGQERIIERLGEAAHGQERVADSIAELKSEIKSR
jgi:hypothetical protein